MFASKASAYPNEAPFIKGKLLAFPTNIRLGWKSLPGANTSVFALFFSYEENEVL
jgi:hypothetical protein